MVDEKVYESKINFYLIILWDFYLKIKFCLSISRDIYGNFIVKSVIILRKVRN